MDHLSWYVSLILFTISTCGTPGPNNYMIMSSGMTYGIGRSIPHVVGINTGFPLMVIAVGLGLCSVLRDTPVIYDILRPLGAVYLLYLAYRTATAAIDIDDDPRHPTRPLTMIQAALFQVLNPKAWVMIIGALVTYGTATGPRVPQVLTIALIFFVFGTPCTAAWLWIGSSLKRLLGKRSYFRTFNVGMAILLVISILPTIREICRSLTT
jgi:threonine/homoserine/homoserine lactone efflux protein